MIPRIRLNKAEYKQITDLRTGSNVGIIGDTHIPFEHTDYLNFCYEVFNKFQCNDIVHIGDEVDNHALSFHTSETIGDSAESEAEKAIKHLDKWYKTFPDVKVCVGNHSALPFRQAQAAGIPARFLKAYHEVWEAPKGWTWETSFILNHVKYTHGTGTTGQMAAINRAIRSRQSTVIGHTHSFGGVSYHASENDLIFGLNAGCGIDVQAYAFNYGKDFVNKPTLGCGIVLDGHTALFIPMKLGRKYEWI